MLASGLCEDPRRKIDFAGKLYRGIETAYFSLFFSPFNEKF